VESDSRLRETLAGRKEKKPEQSGYEETILIYCQFWYSVPGLENFWAQSGIDFFAQFLQGSQDLGTRGIPLLNLIICCGF
jgi:hypothetical protein